MALGGQRQEMEEETVYIHVSAGQLRQDLIQIREACMSFSLTQSGRGLKQT